MTKVKFLVFRICNRPPKTRFALLALFQIVDFTPRNRKSTVDVWALSIVPVGRKPGNLFSSPCAMTIESEAQPSFAT